MDPALGTLAGQSLAWSAVQGLGQESEVGSGPSGGSRILQHHTQSVGVDPEALSQRAVFAEVGAGGR